MGGDSPPDKLFEGVLQAAEQITGPAFPSFSLLVIATHSVVAALKKNYPSSSAVILHPVSDSISMTDDPLQAVRRKSGSSLMTGIRLLKRGKLDALVSTGNTGALLASAALHLPRMPGIRRPAFLVEVPTINGTLAVLDVGGTVSCKAHHLVQFAHLGAAYQRSKGIDTPVVGLLNIGVEPQKGSSNIQQAYAILKNQTIDHGMIFAGNVEGREIFGGGIDILVTDGFTGNIVLKTSEGLSSFIFTYLQSLMQKEPSSSLQQALFNLKQLFNYVEYPGAILCGVESVVVKCHGSSNAAAILNGIKGAVKIIETGLIAKMKAQLSNPVQ